MSKNLVLIFILILSFSYSCKEKQITLQFTNNNELERTGEVVLIKFSDLIAMTGEFPENTLPVFISGKDKLISQIIDLNQDGSIDEILVEISLGAKETRDIEVVFVPDNNYPVFPEKTNVRFVNKSDLATELNTASRVEATVTGFASKIYQMEGPGWENDKVGFRNYFDFRNGMDIFGKKTTDMILDGVGLGVSYHEMNDWGMDILKVGNSLGAGSVGVEYMGKLYRIGDNNIGTFERVYDGPLKSEFKFIFNDWEMESKSYHITQYISIISGQFAYKSHVFAEELPESASLIAGIVNLHSDTLYQEKFPGHVCIFTHAPQTEDTTFLAMGLMIPENYYISLDTAPETGDGITNTFFARTGLDGAKIGEFYFYALWEGSDNRFADLNYVREFFNREALKLNSPVTVSRIK